MINKNQKQGGFTLIEMLVIVSIIGFMASSILAVVHQATLKAKITRLTADARRIQTGLDIIRDQKNQTMTQITQDTCMFCNFNSTTIITSQTSAMNNLKTDWANLGFSPPPLDPWGRPYIFDENEGDPNFSPCSVHDIIISVGPDGKFQSEFSNIDQSTPPGQVKPDLGDDYFFNITFFRCASL